MKGWRDPLDPWTPLEDWVRLLPYADLGPRVVIEDGEWSPWHSAMLVGHVIANEMDESGTARDVSVERIAGRCKLTEQEVEEAVRTVEASGELRVEWAEDGRSFDCFAWLDA